MKELSITLTDLAEQLSHLEGQIIMNGPGLALVLISAADEARKARAGGG